MQRTALLFFAKRREAEILQLDATGSLFFSFFARYSTNYSKKKVAQCFFITFLISQLGPFFLYF